MIAVILIIGLVLSLMIAIPMYCIDKSHEKALKQIYIDHQAKMTEIYNDHEIKMSQINKEHRDAMAKIRF